MTGIERLDVYIQKYRYERKEQRRQTARRFWQDIQIVSVMDTSGYPFRQETLTPADEDVDLKEAKTPKGSRRI